MLASSRICRACEAAQIHTFQWLLVVCSACKKMGQGQVTSHDLLMSDFSMAASWQASIYSVISGGKVISVGMGCDHAHLPLSTINCKEIDLMGSFRYANTVRPYKLPLHFPWCGHAAWICRCSDAFCSLAVSIHGHLLKIT